MNRKILTGPPDTKQLPEASLGVIFYNQLQKWDPKKIAIVDSNYEEITYGEFLSWSVKVAKKLQSLGVQQNDVVTIISQNNWKYVATIVGCFYIGATVNQLNFDYTQGELKHFLAVCKPAVIFCASKSLQHIASLQRGECFAPHVVTYDDFEHFLAATADDGNLVPLESDPKENIALILTSSGTTGFPKCVQLTHSNLRATLLYAHDPLFYDINDTDCLVGYLPVFHISGEAVILTSVLYGAKLVLMDKFIPDRFLQIIQQHKVTKLFVVPSILLFLVKHPLVEQYDLSSIKAILTGAAPVSSEIEKLVEEKLKVKSVRQIYGMTEVCGAAVMTPKSESRFGSSGKVIMNFAIKVCDPESGIILPVGEVGELRIKGGGSMKGYLGDEAQTLKAFDEDGYVRSGDLGYYDEDGYIYIVDRLKEIIKYKGFQVSPSELEALLNKHPAVKEVAVVGKPDERAGEVPVAFVIKQPGVNVTEEELLKYVSENISAQKHLHGGVRFVEEIPKTAGGKILRRKLKELF